MRFVVLTGAQGNSKQPHKIPFHFGRITIKDIDKNNFNLAFGGISIFKLS
jgi:hypothetical protein